MPSLRQFCNFDGRSDLAAYPGLYCSICQLFNISNGEARPDCCVKETFRPDSTVTSLHALFAHNSRPAQNILRTANSKPRPSKYHAHYPAEVCLKRLALAASYTICPSTRSKVVIGKAVSASAPLAAVVSWGSLHHAYVSA